MTRPENIKLVAAIDAFLAGSGMAPSTFGFKAVNNGKFVARLKSGSRVWPETSEKVFAFIVENAWMCSQYRQFSPRARQAEPAARVSGACERRV